jgi:hypothetical protein
MTRTIHARCALASVLFFTLPMMTACDDDEAADNAGHDDEHSGSTHNDEHSEPGHDDEAAGSGAVHEHSDEHGDEMVGPLTGAKCPSDSALTYDNFGKDFLGAYCLRCHSQSVSGDARMMAPSDHNFDTLLDIELLASHIDQLAGAGPDATNVKMPPSGAKPTDEERKKLSEWLACGHPE